MKQTWMKPSILAVAFALFAPAMLLAQKDDKIEKIKDIKEKKEVEQIIITRNSDNKEKVVIEINGDKVTVNGQPIEEYKDKDGNVSVMRSKHTGVYNSLVNRMNNNAFTYTPNKDLDYFKSFGIDSNRAMLGVTTEKVDEGVKIQSITKESAAEKAGLKENDIITKVDDKVIGTPDDLSEVIQKHKVGDKVNLTFLRDKKEQKVTPVLTMWKSASLFGNPGNFKMDMGNMDFSDIMPKVPSTPRVRVNGFRSNTPKLGLSVQDTDDGKGVKVLDVDNESNAQKAGVKNEDVITEVDGKAVNSADEVAKIIRESKDKVSIMLKLQRAGKTMNIELKMPRLLKTADF
jgi:serine protease Do